MSKLRIEHLQKSFSGRSVVKDVSLEINSNQIVGLLGPNGAGKTTAFYMVVGLIKADGGKITLDEEDISTFPMHLRARHGISYLPQEPSIFRKLSVEDNLLAILELRGDLTKTQRYQKADQLLRELHIAHLRNNKSYSLSGGERRRVEIARALTTEPKFILLDEPFAGIDPISVVDIKHIIRHLREQKIGVLITDHNVRETLDICDHAYIVNEGEIICTGNAETILNNEKVRQVYLGDDFEL
jgi:lipopolysaccharide export system ATP-binding protein